MAAYRKNVAYRNATTYPGGGVAPPEDSVAGRSTSTITARRSTTAITVKRSTTGR